MSDIDSTIVPAEVFKPIDGPWIGLLVLSIFILVSSIIAMIVLYFLWRRHQQLTQFYNESYILSNRPTGKRQIPVQIQEQQLKPYETQKIETFVPQHDQETIHGRFTPHNDIQKVRHFYEKTTNAYF